MNKLSGILLFITCICFTLTPTVDANETYHEICVKNEYRTTEYEWGNWQTYSCYSNIQYRIRCEYADYLSGKNKYIYRIQIRNDYTRAIDVGWTMSDAPPIKTMRRTTIEPGQYNSEIGSTFFLETPCGQEVYIGIGNLNFKGEYNEYHLCDNGAKNPIDNKSRNKEDEEDDTLGNGSVGKNNDGEDSNNQNTSNPSPQGYTNMERSNQIIQDAYAFDNHTQMAYRAISSGNLQRAKNELAAAKKFAYANNNSAAVIQSIEKSIAWHERMQQPKENRNLKTVKQEKDPMEIHRQRYEKVLEDHNKREDNWKALEREQAALKRKNEATLSKINNLASSDWGNASSPEAIIRESEQRLDELGRYEVNGLSLFNEKFEEKQFQSEQFASTLSGKDADEYRVVSGVLNIASSALEASREKKERERARQAIVDEKNRRLEAYLLEQAEEFKKSAAVSIQKAAYAKEEKKEKYYLEQYSYSTCMNTNITTNLNARTYTEFGCTEPQEKFAAEKNPNYLEIAARKMRIYNSENELELFKIAAEEFMQLGIEENPKDPAIYIFKAEHLSNSTKEKKKNYEYAEMLSGEKGLYTTKINLCDLSLKQEFLKAIKEGKFTKASIGFSENRHTTFTEDQIKNLVNTCIEKDHYNMLQLCEKNMPYAAAYTSQKASTLTGSLMRYDAINCFKGFRKRQLISGTKQELLKEACFPLAKKIANELIDEMSINELQQVSQDLQANNHQNSIASLNKLLMKKGQKNNNEEMILLAAGVNDSKELATQENGNTLLYQSILDGKKELTKRLLKSKKIREQINIASPKGLYPIHLAAMQGDAWLVERLLDWGADIDIKEKSGRTPIHLAIKNQKVEVVKVLKRYRANLDSKDNNGITPVKMAKQLGDKEMKNILS